MSNSDADELVALTATAAAAQIRAGELTAQELVDAHLTRIETYNPRVNAIVTIDPEGALARAASADAVPLAQRGPLHGVPIAIKDTAQTAGMRTTYGLPQYADNIPPSDDLHVARIMQAGAILIGKTNVPEGAVGSHTVNRVFGATRNPYDLSRSAGGSSGGAAAALASRFIPIADGSDMGGSLRNPASFCSVVGIRPTPGMVPNSEGSDTFNPLATNGAMARTVSDAALLLSVIAVPGPADIPTPLIDPVTLRNLDPIPLRGLRVAYAPDLGGRVPVDPQVRDVLDRTATLLTESGAQVSLACPDLDGADAAFRTLRAADFDLMWGDVLSADPDAFVDFMAGNIRAGQNLSGREVMAAYAEITRLRRAAARFFANFDVVLAPAAQIPPFPVEWDWPHAVAGVVMDDYLQWMRAAWLFTPLGIPGLSLPAGFTPSGLPVGAQILAAAGNDVGLLRVALRVERTLDLPFIDPLKEEQYESDPA
ncbi:MAG: amidase family protein [Gordonia sp. (in: high G+C Gram-positive bacteria)]